MSRHRMVRNLTEDDYYDDYDDYYEDDDYEDDHLQQQYAPPSLSKPVSKAPASAFSAPVAAAPAPSAQIPWPKPKPAASTAPTIAKGSVTKPPPGWGKPSNSEPAGVAQPPPAWGKPSSNSAPPTNTASAGVAKPPAGWGKPTPPQSQKATTSAPAAGVMKPPAGWGKPSSGQETSSTKIQETRTKATAPRSGNKGSVYVPKAVPDVLKNAKSQLSMVVLGHVDAGKSTMMGQVLVQAGYISKREAQKKPMSWILDENEQERERGVTMEIGTKTVRVPNHDIVLLDAPGHADFVPIMITGAANADVAILVVAANTGEFEAGFDGGGQTKEHVLLARGLGVTQILVAINKLDMEDWSKQRYDQIQAKVKSFLLQQQFAPKRIRFVPLSGLTGENVKSRNDPKLSTWYKGPTLLDAMNDFFPAKRQLEKPLRFGVTDVFAEGKGVVARGRVMQGFLEAGERLVVLPIGDVVTVNKLEHLQPPTTDDNDKNALKRLSIGMAGDTVELVLSGIELVRLSVGSILSNPNARPPLTKKAKAKVFILDSVTIPIIRGARVLFHMQSLDIPATVSKLVALTKSGGEVTKERPRALTRNSSAIVEITLNDRIAMEQFSSCRALGRFVLRRSGDTIAVGVIDELL